MEGNAVQRYEDVFPNRNLENVMGMMSNNDISAFALSLVTTTVRLLLSRNTSSMLTMMLAMVLSSTEAGVGELVSSAEFTLAMLAELRLTIFAVL